MHYSGSYHCLLLIVLSAFNYPKAEALQSLYGEIVVCSDALKNGIPAISGTTIQNEDRIWTGENGGALIQLGRVGKFELGPRTEMKFRFSDQALKGELLKGRLLVKTRRGVNIEISTSKGLILANGRTPTRIEIDLEHEGSILVRREGEARWLAGGGEKATAKGVIWKDAASNASFSRRAQFLTGIENAGKAVLNRNRRRVRRYESTVTCLENETFACRKWGDVRP